jgi:isocitrate dehydrogenase
MDINGYYFADAELAAKAMRPSETLNTILSSLL